MRKEFTAVVLVLLFCLGCFKSYSQNKFVKGFYVTNQLDTVQTYILNKHWEKNPDIIKVRNEVKAGETKIFKVNQIKAFGLNSGDIYIRGFVEIDKSPVRLNALEENPAPNIVTDSVFLKVLVKGVFSLLYFKDENDKEHFYIQKGQETLKELILKKELKNINGNKGIITSEIYKEQLSSAFKECRSINDLIRKSRYTASSLKNVFIQYHSCLGNETIYSAKAGKVVYKLGAVAGISKTNLSFSGESEHSELPATKFKQSTNATAGVALNILLPAKNNRLSIYNEILYKAYETNGSYENYITQYRNSSAFIEFDLAYVGIGSMIRFYTPIATIKPFFSVGVANNFCIKNYNLIQKNTHNYGTDSYKEERVIPDLRKHEQAFLFGTGITSNKVSTEIRYELGNGVSSYIHLGSKKQVLSFLLTYYVN